MPAATASFCCCCCALRPTAPVGSAVGAAVGSASGGGGGGGGCGGCCAAGFVRAGRGKPPILGKPFAAATPAPATPPAVTVPLTTAPLTTAPLTLLCRGSCDSSGCGWNGCDCGGGTPSTTPAGAMLGALRIVLRGLRLPNMGGSSEGSARGFEGAALPIRARDGAPFEGIGAATSSAAGPAALALGRSRVGAARPRRIPNGGYPTPLARSSSTSFLAAFARKRD